MPPPHSCRGYHGKDKKGSSCSTCTFPALSRGAQPSLGQGHFLSASRSLQSCHCMWLGHGCFKRIQAKDAIRCRKGPRESQFFLLVGLQLLPGSEREWDCPLSLLCTAAGDRAGCLNLGRGGQATVGTRGDWLESQDRAAGSPSPCRASLRQHSPWEVVLGKSPCGTIGGRG